MQREDKGEEKFLTNKDLKNLMEIFLTTQYTKELPRQGLIQFGYKRSEADSIAAHSFSTSLLSLMLSEKIKDEEEVDQEKVLKISLLHDMGEAVTGDFGFFSKLLDQDAFDKVERKAFESLLDKTSFSEEYSELWKDYEDQSSIEAQIVKVADILDAIALAKLTPSADISGFYRMREIKREKLKDRNPYLEKLMMDASEMILNDEVKPYRRFEENSE